MARLIERIGHAVSFAGSVAAETVWPTRCALCDAPGEVVCASCLHALRPIDACRACTRCGAPYGRVQCTECNDLMMERSGRTRLPYRSAAFALVADDAARRLVKVYKDKGERRLAGIISELCARQISPDRIREGCALTFIPATAEAVRRRGFDHAQELACLIAERAHIPCVKLLDAPTAVDQRGLTRQERAANMADALRIHPGAPVPRDLIVFDDICTTGSTLYAAGDALAAAGAANLHALAFGRVLD